MLVTVAIPVFNGERFIRRAIEGILAQTFPDFELLVLNDASTDDTRAIVESFADSRLKLVTNERNLGGYGNFNKCLALAEGKYVFLNHADDVMMPQLLERTVSVCEQDAGLACAGVNAEIIDENGNTGGPYFRYAEADVVFSGETFLDSYFRRYTMAVSSVLLRKELLRKNRLLFDKKNGKCADMAFWVQLALCAQRMYFFHEPLFYRRMHASQWSASFFKTESDIEEYIMKTDWAILQALAASKLNSESKERNIQRVLSHMYSLSIELSARKREQILRQVRKRAAPLLGRSGLKLADTALKVYSY